MATKSRKKKPSASSSSSGEEEGYEEEQTPKRTRKVNVLSKKDFNELVDTIVAQERQLRDASSLVYSLGKSKSFTIPPSAQFPRFEKEFNFGRAELKSLFTEHQRSIKQIKRLYAAAFDYKVKKPVKKKPAVFTDPLIEFFKEANLGTSYEKRGDKWYSTGEPLLASLPLFEKRGIAFTETVINLFYIYSYVNNLQEGSVYHADDLMKQYLTPVFQAITNYDEARPKRTKVIDENKKKGQVRELGGTFDPDAFAMTGFNRIARWTKYFKPDEKDVISESPKLTEEQLEELYSPEIMEQMEKEYAEVQAAKHVHKLIKNKAKKEKE